MQTHTYSFDELSEEKAMERWGDHTWEYHWLDEIFESLKGLFEKCDGVTLDDYNLREHNSSISISFEYDEVEDFTGKRAMAWIENNLLYCIRTPYRGDRRKEIRRYGASYYAGKIPPCPFTGYYADDYFLDCLLGAVKRGNTLKDSFECLAGEYQRLYNAEIEHQNSDEYIREAIQSNGYEFTKDGTLY